ncbi:ExbD/TolR family protein [Xylanibacter muris]|uniref:Biopolymer transporter ExbD n=1 Tax=Xylanibacter muris TaxID=2736290 RepID=A0ABX2APS8_9BACT|nr:biopolymer transporter ExbD [Xylanibacter muris]NPD93184.1 biopolymer transporter ExbD [Xylanibacter muris]
MSMFRRKIHEVPELNTASLPDLIFIVLFFFMVVTHMKETTMKVRYEMPQGTRLEQVVAKSSVIHIYIGKPVAGNRTDTFRIQINDRYTDIQGLAGVVASERSRMSPEDVERMTVSIRADRNTPMGLISDVKQALRKVGAYRINYAADEKTVK